MATEPISVDLIIGKPPCDVLEVRNAVQKSPGQLNEKWRDFARALKIEETEILELAVHVQGDTKNYGELMFQIISKFQARNGNNAKLSVFIEALKECDHQCVADKLNETFVAVDDSTENETKKPPISEEEIQIKLEHLTTNKQELVNNTEVNIKITVELEAQGILGYADVMELDTTQDPVDKGNKLYDMMILKCPIGYDELIDVLRETDQDSAADILQKVYENLEDCSQNIEL